MTTETAWKTIDQYEHSAYAGYDPKVLLGWWFDEGGGYSAGVRSFAIGYWNTIRKTWYGLPENEPLYRHPTHFALVCNFIPLEKPYDPRI